jgi:hypothetical protein
LLNSDSTRSRLLKPKLRCSPSHKLNSNLVKIRHTHLPDSKVKEVTPRPDPVPVSILVWEEDLLNLKGDDRQCPVTDTRRLRKLLLPPRVGQAAVRVVVRELLGLMMLIRR